MVLESPFWLKYVPKSETFWSWVWNDISRFSSSYDSSVVLVLYSLYFDENLGDFRSNMFARIDNIMWWDGPFSTVLYLFFATGVAHILIKLTMNGLENCQASPKRHSRKNTFEWQALLGSLLFFSFFLLFFFFFSFSFPLFSATPQRSKFAVIRGWQIHSLQLKLAYSNISQISQIILVKSKTLPV